MNQEQGIDANAVIDELLNQIKELNRDKAINAVLTSQIKSKLEEIQANSTD